MNKHIVKLILSFLASMVFAHAVGAAKYKEGLSLSDTQGHAITRATLQDKWVLINYWAPWCEACVHEIPELNRFYLAHQNDSIMLLGVNYEAVSPTRQKEFLKKLNIKYPNLTRDPSHELHLGEITGVPVTFVLNPEGKLVKTLYGEQTARGLNKLLKRLAAKKL